MKPFIILFFIAFFSFTATAQMYSYCQSDVFSTDTGKYFFITEIKPTGTDRFIEIYNCRDSSYSAEQWFCHGMYSNVTDSGAVLVIEPHEYAILPLPNGLRLSDAVQIITRKDTSVVIMDAVGYTISDSTKSISLCGWFVETEPTPLGTNYCSTLTSITTHQDERNVASIRYFDIIGNQLSKPCRGITVTVTMYTDGTTTVQKIFSSE